MNGSSLLAVCLLVLAGTGPVLGCEWIQSNYPGHGPTFLSLQPAIERSCLEACCKQAHCDMVLVGFPVNGKPPCQQVDCSPDQNRDRDLCGINSSALFTVYRKKGERKAGRQAAGGGEEQSNNQTDVRCRQPMKVGLCRASFPKFYYDVTNQSCRRFVYGGCGANSNNFESQEECEDACSGVTGSVLPDESTAAPEGPAKAPRMAPPVNSKVSRDAEGPVKSEPSAVVSNPPPQNTEMPPDEFAERCGVKPQAGPCRAAFQRWYYDSKTGSCETFIFGGCRANKNNYLSKESCMTTCTVSVLPSSQKISAGDDVSTGYKDNCMVTSDPGPCRAAFPMFYYDPNTATCQSFLYGGCRGNQNRYGTLEECMSRCSRDGAFDTRGKARDRWTPAIFLFVTLAAISALLLAALVIVTVRRHSLSRRPSSISDKEELLPDPDEQSSLESLTIPESPKPGQA